MLSQSGGSQVALKESPVYELCARRMSQHSAVQRCGRPAWRIKLGDRANALDTGLA